MIIRYINGYVDAPQSAKYFLMDKGDYASLQYFETTEYYKEIATFNDAYIDKDLFRTAIKKCREKVGHHILWVERPMWMFSSKFFL